MEDQFQDPAQKKPRADPSLTPLLRSVLLELAIYAPLVTLYFIIVIRLAGPIFTNLFNQSLIAYAFFATLTVVLQGILLEALTSWLLRRIGLRQ
jgi:hypothetical protein